MAQVTIYIEDGALQAARTAAARQSLSLSQWFAQFAAQEKKRQAQDWDALFAQLDAISAPEADAFPDPETLRRNDVPDLPREPW
jgi:hypothetical protein